jgi:hypothetical protein
MTHEALGVEHDVEHALLVDALHLSLDNFQTRRLRVLAVLLLPIHIKWLGECIQ